jgi:hypothetical protein
MLCTSQIKKQTVRECSSDWERRGAYRILVKKPEGRIEIIRPRRTWQDNIKMDHHEMVVGHGLD